MNTSQSHIYSVLGVSKPSLAFDIGVRVGGWGRQLLRNPSQKLHNVRRGSGQPHCHTSNKKISHQDIILGCRDVSCLLWQDKAVHAAWQVWMVLITCKAFIETNEIRSAFLKFQLSFEISFTCIYSGLNATLVRASIPCMWMLRWALATRPPIGLTACRRLFQGFRFRWIFDTFFANTLLRFFMVTLKRPFVTMPSTTLFGRNMAVFQRGSCRGKWKELCLNSVDCGFYSPLGGGDECPEASFFLQHILIRYNWKLDAPDVKFYPLRPELMESTYLLYRCGFE